MAKIVVMGGSFNPPTIAHQRLLLDAVNALGADKGIFVPSSHTCVSIWIGFKSFPRRMDWTGSVPPRFGIS